MGFSKDVWWVTTSQARRNGMCLASGVPQNDGTPLSNMMRNLESTIPHRLDLWSPLRIWGPREGWGPSCATEAAGA